MLLKVENLKVHFPIRKGLLSKTVGYVYAVDGVSFELKKGETLGIVGESGCGKTTTGLAVQRLINHTSGSIFYQGEDISTLTKAQLRPYRKKIQTIFQDPFSSLNPRMTVEQILADPLIIHGIKNKKKRMERVHYLLEKVGLSPEHTKRYPHEFSGGQRQRIGIARALVLNPELVIADEPVSALDVSIQAQIINLLIDIQKEFGLSYIVVAHDLAVVEYICDQIAVMYLGKIIETGLYKDIYLNPKHPYTKALLSAVPEVEKDKRKERVVLEGDVPSPINPPLGCSFHPRCPQRFDICDSVVPELTTNGEGHRVSCHLYGKEYALN
jgi:oligopeptide/dipeptide ABC transporter ATP-binding protein